MELAARFEQALATELVAVLSDKLSPGDRRDCYAIELLFYPDQNPFHADVEVLACSEEVLRARPNFSESDLELRWNHASLHPDGDLATLPATMECRSAQLEWQLDLGVRHEWASGSYPAAGEERDEYRRLGDLVAAGYRQMLVRIVQRLHRDGTISELFDTPIPLVISHLEPVEAELVATVDANGIELSGSFLDYLVEMGLPPRSDLMVQAADQRFRAATTSMNDTE